MRKNLALFAVLGLLSGCSPNVENRGYLKEPDWNQQVTPGQTTRQEVLSALGSPSSTSSFGQETWYYINTRRESFAFLKPEVADQNVTRITFDSAGVVESVDEIGKDKARDISISSRETPTEGHQLTIMEQLLGNLGRFNSPGTTPGSSPAGGTQRGRR